MPVLLFSHILNIKKSQARQMERRLERRYTPGRNFPLFATIEVEDEPRSAKVLDLSSGGAGLQVTGPPYVLGSSAKLYLMLEEMCMDFDCSIAHVKILPSGCRLGLTAKFEDFAARKTYLQLLQPVAIGSAMRMVPPEEIRQNEATMHKLMFTGPSGTELNVWRQGDVTGELHSFLWQMDDFVVRGDTATGVMQISTRKQIARPSKLKAASPPAKLSGGISDEIRLLFRWTMMNLPKEMPGDIRTYLQGFVD